MHFNLRSLNITDLIGVVMVILVVGRGDGQHFRGHKHLKDVDCSRSGGGGEEGGRNQYIQHTKLCRLAQKKIIEGFVFHRICDLKNA